MARILSPPDPRIFATHLMSGARRIERGVFDDQSADAIAAFGQRLRIDAATSFCDA